MRAGLASILLGAALAGSIPGRAQISADNWKVLEVAARKATEASLARGAQGQGVVFRPGLLGATGALLEDGRLVAICGAFVPLDSEGDNHRSIQRNPDGSITALVEGHPADILILQLEPNVDVFFGSGTTDFRRSFYPDNAGDAESFPAPLPKASMFRASGRLTNDAGAELSGRVCNFVTDAEGTPRVAQIRGLLTSCDAMDWPEVPEASDLIGTWGGYHIRLDVAENGARVEYDCAHGTIDEPLVPDEEGNFEARGHHVFERGGPRYPGEPEPRSHPARYRGCTNGKQMRLTVTLLDTGQDVGTFSLVLGQPASLEKCY